MGGTEQRTRDIWGRFKNVYELLNLIALKLSSVYKIRIVQCIGEIFCVEFQRVPLKFQTKYLTHTLKDTIFIQCWHFKSSLVLRAHTCFWTPHGRSRNLPLRAWSERNTILKIYIFKHNALFFRKIWLTHCSLVMPCDVIELGKHWFR